MESFRLKHIEDMLSDPTSKVEGEWICFDKMRITLYNPDKSPEEEKQVIFPLFALCCYGFWEQKVMFDELPLPSKRPCYVKHVMTLVKSLELR